MSRTTYGTEIGPSQWAPERSIIAEPETSYTGNLVLRVGRENEDHRSCHFTEHVVLTPEEAREYVAKLTTLFPDDAAQRPLPKVTIHELPRVTVAGDTYTPILRAEFYGDNAVALAEKHIDQLLGGVPWDDPSAPDYNISVSDDRCGVCGEMFSSEARFETDEGWVCPVCGGDPRPGP